jgi:hypothetical protein
MTDDAAPEPAHHINTPEPAHHINTCVQCRDWGHIERHEDHWPTRVTPSAEDA